MRLARHAKACKNVQSKDQQAQQSTRNRFRYSTIASGPEEDRNNDRLNVKLVQITAHRNTAISSISDKRLEEMVERKKKKKRRTVLMSNRLRVC